MGGSIDLSGQRHECTQWMDRNRTWVQNRYSHQSSSGHALTANTFLVQCMIMNVRHVSSLLKCLAHLQNLPGNNRHACQGALDQIHA